MASVLDLCVKRSGVNFLRVQNQLSPQSIDLGFYFGPVCEKVWSLHSGIQINFILHQPILGPILNLCAKKSGVYTLEVQIHFSP